MRKVHSEISYVRQSDNCNVHSDTCPFDCNKDNISDEEYRRFIHDVLDEWIDKSNGTGFFYIGDPESLKANWEE